MLFGLRGRDARMFSVISWVIGFRKQPHDAPGTCVSHKNTYKHNVETNVHDNKDRSALWYAVFRGMRTAA